MADMKKKKRNKKELILSITSLILFDRVKFGYSAYSTVMSEIADATVSRNSS